MKKMNCLWSLSAMVLAVFFSVGMLSCSEDEENGSGGGLSDGATIMGLWASDITGEDFMIYSFNTDGSGAEYYGIDSNNKSQVEYFTYSFDQSAMELKLVYAMGDPWKYKVKELSSQKLILIDVMDDEEMSFHRYNGSLPSVSEGNNGDGNESDENNGGSDNDDNGNNDGGGIITQLSAPTGITASLSGNSIVIKWNSVPGATRYKVYRSRMYSGTFSLLSTVTSTTVTDNNPIDGYNYYKVKAVNSSNESDYSSLTYCEYEAKQAAPSTPTGLRAVQDGNTIVISWNAVSNAYYYRLWYNDPLGVESFTNVYAPNTSCVFDRNLHNGTYTFWIQALNSDYEASGSSSKKTCYYSAQNNGNDDNDEPTISKLSAPTNVEAYGTSYDSYVQISFDAVSLAYEYHLYRSTSPTYGYTKITASGGSTSGGRYVLTDQNPKKGTTYYKVKAVASSWSNIDDSDFSSYVKVSR